MSNPPVGGHEQLAGIILGVALGSQTDLGRSDAEIMELCKNALAQIRRAMACPVIVSELANALNKVQQS